VNRGDIWSYQAISRTRKVLVISADELNNVGQPITLDVTDVAPTGVRAMLATPLPDHGYILVRSMFAADPNRFRERLGRAPVAVMDQLEMALRAALDL
jgi:mRNA-degrading endonuclease toxin of MazEF toxin-antitoxin module